MLINLRFFARKGFLFILLLAVFVFISCSKQEVEKDDSYYTGWSSYLGGPERNHFSTLSQITPENVNKLQLAWSYASKDYGQMQMNPIVVDTILYGVTAALRVFALNAASGEEIWQFGDSVKVWHSTSRGVAYWEKANDKRILFTRGPYLFALDALSGKPIPGFGDNGKVDMRSGMPASAKNKFVISNTPGTIYKDLIVMPLRLSEGPGAPPGDIIAFNVISGAVEWVFHTIPEKGEAGAETWGNEDIRNSGIVGAANNWAGMAVDTVAGIIYVPTGSAAPDFYGGFRKGSNLYSNCLLALDAATGKRKWHFQFTHHDVWDRDPPAPPNLITLERNGKKIPAVAQVTKQGYVYVFDRYSGSPLFEIEEVPVPASTLEGEEVWPTQPIPKKPAPFARQSTELTEADISPYADNKEELLEIFRNSDKRIYAPPALDPVILLPGYDGAAEWGGASADPEKGILYVNSNEMPRMLQMAIAAKRDPNLPAGEGVYNKYCASCHQTDLKGSDASGFPSLLDLQLRMEKTEVFNIIRQGKGMMTGFPDIPKEESEALLRFLFNEEIQHSVAESSSEAEVFEIPFLHKGYNKFLDNKGLPAISPPWGTLHAIDLNTGEYIWSVPFGETPELAEQGVKGTGTENYGGAVITKNGLLFIGATRDGFFRVYNRHTGEVLWEYKLPAAAFATPAMYEVDGKQYIAIACGGEKLGTEKGNQIIAFSIEE
ncbi:MAG: pyrroloquinoline quinone-dependent dehydrogenase [Eudoraea sp.]|nr:pyrroloquinoline quinone-dependent dehydrogenase [Eudoraea sp.]